ncbi:MAG: exodeoxyribonuclease VII large subunit [Bryobacterales bacterium]|nr:exodeoxyribonuclease VII large subunit [Bryobacterales bacterium]
MEQLALSWEQDRRVFTVAALNAAIRALLERQFDDIRVAGEISGVKLAASGHYYFTLKDHDALLRCVCFRNAARLLKFKPQDGVSVLARGRIDVYEPRGEYQLLVEALEPQGHGALQFAFEQLKQKLAAEGLFEAARKRPLPKLPRRIGIVTSPAGAAIRDMIQVLTRRFPGIEIRLYPAQVQGEGSIEAVAGGIEYFSNSGWADVLIVGRGGGSLEDLWTFNEERVARAIAACSIPVVSAVGHETDFSISDFVADLRAPTPSAAAELVVTTRDQLLEQIAGFAHKLKQAIRYRLSWARRELQEQGVDRAEATLRRRIGRSHQRVDEMEYRLRDRGRFGLDRERRAWQALELRLRQMDLRLRLAAVRHRLEALKAAGIEVMRQRLAGWHRSLDPMAVKLTQLSPLAVLERGYAIVETPDGRVLRDAAGAGIDSEIRIRLARGRLGAKVTESYNE